MAFLEGTFGPLHKARFDQEQAAFAAKMKAVSDRIDAALSQFPTDSSTQITARRMTLSPSREIFQFA